MGRFTELARRAYAGDREAESELLDLCYDSLRRMAANRSAGYPPNATIQGTALVHEAYVRVHDKERAWASRTAFFGLIARAMHDVLVEEARRYQALKRGGHFQRVELDEPLHDPSRLFERADLDEALDALLASDSTAHDVFIFDLLDWRHADIAEALGIGVATVGRKLRKALAVLSRRFGDDDSDVIVSGADAHDR